MMNTYCSEGIMSIEEKKHYIDSHNDPSDLIGFYDSFCVRQAMTDNIRPKSPFYVSWNVTNRCNLRCKYCSNESEYNSYNELTKNEKLSLVDKLAGIGVRHLFLLGGEPTLIEGFNEILDRVLSNNIFLSFSTNGVGITAETINVLKKYSTNLYKINVSCDSIIEENNALNRGGNSYANAINALCLLNSIKDINLTFFSVVTEHTKKDIIPTYEYLKERKIKSYGITIAMKKGRATDEDIIDADEIVDDLYTIIKDSEQTRVTEVYASLGYSSHENSKSKAESCKLTEKEQNIYFREKCNCCITRLHIECNGDVYPCDNLKYPAFNLGNVSREALTDLWNSDLALQIAGIRRRDKKECSMCPIENCTTGCMGLAYEAYQSIYRKDPNCILFISGKEGQHEKDA